MDLCSSTTGLIAASRFSFTDYLSASGISLSDPPFANRSLYRRPTWKTVVSAGNDRNVGRCRPQSSAPTPARGGPPLLSVGRGHHVAPVERFPIIECLSSWGTHELFARRCCRNINFCLGFISMPSGCSVQSPLSNPRYYGANRSDMVSDKSATCLFFRCQRSAFRRCASWYTRDCGSRRLDQ